MISPEAKLIEFRELIKKSLTKSLPSRVYDKYIDLLDDCTLNRFLIAKKCKGECRVSVSCSLLVEALKWRDAKQLEQLDNFIQDMEKEGCTGKIYLPGFDRWNRPIVVFDNTVQNTSDMNGQLRYLAWSLNLAIRFMPADVDKYVVFINLENFSLFCSPSFACSKETINMLQNMFPERMGHCICYKPPSYFSVFFNIVKPFVDPKTVSKMVFLNGDVSDGSENDILMQSIIGQEWKRLSGACQEVVVTGSSPGYNHQTYWPLLLERIRSVQDKESQPSKRALASEGLLVTSSSRPDGESPRLVVQHTMPTPHTPTGPRTNRPQIPYLAAKVAAKISESSSAPEVNPTYNDIQRSDSIVQASPLRSNQAHTSSLLSLSVEPSKVSSVEIFWMSIPSFSFPLEFCLIAVVGWIAYVIVGVCSTSKDLNIF